MADKVFVPKTNELPWDSYWKKTNYQREMELCKSDGLLPIFDQYLNKRQAIIEAGCGAGKWVIYLGKKGYQIIGVDNNRLGLKKLKEYYPKAKAKYGDVRKMPFGKNRIDVYISLGVVEHFETGPIPALKDAFRILKPGGLAIVEVPFDNPLRRLRRSVGKLKFWRQKPKGREFYEYHYTKEELAGFMSKAGFKEIKYFPKDDLDPGKSIALWLDWPKLRRKIDNPDFKLTTSGQGLKQIFNLLKLNWWYSACMVAVAKKPE